MKSLAAILIFVMLWGVGLLSFTARIQRSTPPPEPAAADAIVALTGGSIQRVTEGIDLLEHDKGQRLLVSGVNPEVTRSELQSVARAQRSLFDCCVQLGFYAADTEGNAAETAAWASHEGYDSLIVVTSDYHMPRAILEMKGAMPNVTLTPYPIVTPELNAKRWWRTNQGAQRMILEYCKYLAVLGREAFLSLGPDERKAAEPKTTEAQ